MAGDGETLSRQPVGCRPGVCWLHPRQGGDVCGTGTQRLPSGLSWLSWTRHGINREASSRMCKVKGAPVCREAGKRPKGPQDRSLDSKATCLLNMEKGKEAAYA